MLHLIFGFLLRLGFIAYGALQDSFSEVPYTDIDYKVFTDAARYVYEGDSPYERHTYRYSPLIAFMLVPNVALHPAFGKILFSLVDVLVTWVIQELVILEGVPRERSLHYGFLWLFNPLSVIISTRGNSDSLAAFLVLLTLLLFRKERYISCGLLHGLAIHFRLYPVLFSLPMYLALSNNHPNVLVRMLVPNKKRFCLVFSCASSLLYFTLLSYHLYGDAYLNESLLYHVQRNDVRHNFSLYFYSQYLGLHSGKLLKILMLLPQLFLFTMFSIKYSDPDHLAFGEFCISFVLVAYNSVLTCQYFIWFLCFLPVCLPKMRDVLKAGKIVIVWCLAQVAWLYPAYLLEFKGLNTFLWIWFQGLLFFISNVFLIVTCIESYESKVKQM